MIYLYDTFSLHDLLGLSKADLFPFLYKLGHVSGWIP